MNRRDRRRSEKLAKAESAASASTNASKAALGRALEAFKSGDGEKAQKLIGDVLKQTPENADALHFLGLIAHQSGRGAEAIGHLQKACEIETENAIFHANLGAILNSQGRAAEAEAACTRCLEIDPGSVEGHNNRAISRVTLGRLEDAGDDCQRALAVKPDMADALITLGTVRHRQHEFTDAVSALNRAIEAAPDNPIAHANLGAALRGLGLFDEAIQACRTAIQLNPNHVDAHNNLGNALRERGDMPAAAESFQNAIRLRPDFVDAWINLGAALYRLMRVEEAEVAYGKALEHDSGSAPAHSGMGTVLLALGRLDDAERHYRRALAINPMMADVRYALAASGRGNAESDAVAIEQLLENPDVALDDAVLLNFALGEVHTRGGDTDAGFVAFAEGNRLRRSVMDDAGQTFDAAAFDASIDAIIEAFGADTFAGEPIFGEGEESDHPVSEHPVSDRPVFIIGMPRSGTTLVEQIAASHPGVFGAGELGVFTQLQGFPASVIGLDAEQVDAIRQTYLDRLTSLSADALRVCDKTPFNFLFLGWLARVFPQARFIHCRRDLRDTAVSCYFQNFVASYPWSTSLDDIAHYSQGYLRLMDHWRAVLPGNLLEVDYEDLIENVEAGSRRIIDHLGLEWDDACLEFHTTKRPVRTASSWQVRKPVYRTSAGRWRAYKDELGDAVLSLPGYPD